MYEHFELLIQSFSQDQIGISNHFIDNALAIALKQRIALLTAQKQFTKAGVGAQHDFELNSLVRSDSIFWLDRSHNNAFETAYLSLLDEFIKYLNMECYTGITNCEFHFATYPIGGFYRKHKDQFSDNSSRKYSLITYLNDDWIKSDGGELKVYAKSGEVEIAPILGKTVFFKSNELPHEVLTTNTLRYSITGWLKT